MITKLNITLEQNEFNGLLQLAEKEIRSAPDQARWVLRQHLTERGILPNIEQVENNKKHSFAEKEK